MYAISVTYLCWCCPGPPVKAVFTKFLHCKVTVPIPVPFSYWTLVGKSLSLLIAHPKGLGSFAQLLDSRKATEIMWESSSWEIVSSSIFINLFNHLWRSLCIHGCFFYTLGYNPILLYLFYWLNCSNFDHEELFSWLLFSFNISHHWILFCLGHCLTFRTTKCLYITCPSPLISHLGSFYWRLVLETKTWVPSVLFATGMSKPSQLIEKGCLCAHINLCIYTYLKSSHMSLNDGDMCLRILLGTFIIVWTS